MKFTFKDDSTTWQLFKDGDREAFAFIYNRYTSNLYAYGMRLLQDEEETRDAIHELFVKLWQRRKTIGYTDNIKYYLITSFRNIIYTLKGIENRMPQADLSEAEDFDLSFNLESEFIHKEQSKELSKKLLEALGQLTPRQKEILYLRYFEELSYQEIAVVMDITVKASYKLSARALEALRELMNLPLSVVLFLLFTSIKTH
ncbi:RNA polymerase sigma factor [Sphingobacterium faecale]|uniref:Sigma-70 family RNA polymerase sigma factor n=1 Tax=Sphingobacterium faecale TaxID=2803775 RepID=A0ABS1R223_9SPHI|nr:sigma-70 family RNA polymerase sigma factor [Sphingobacterium faecale]MBL1408737.1 sigma-70 family RNA polymerase sigma factor [Sphingobacterium faecale]